MTSIYNQYLDEEQIQQEIPFENFQVQDLITIDTYNERKLINKLLEYTKEEQLLLQKCAIHIAIIGAGNRNYGRIKHNNIVYNIVDIFNKLNIKHNNKLSERLEEDTLTSRRLVRIYRYHIQKYIQLNKRPSYLFLKYSNRDINYMNICFPGAEHFIKDGNQYDYLMSVYKNIDQRLNTNFQEKIMRVGLARGIIQQNLR